MFQFLANTQVGGCRSFPCHLQHRITTLAFLLTTTVISQLFSAPPLQADQEPRPNIILILSDDMGYSDIEPYGGEIKTPHLQQLADGGLRFTQFYNTARCCPTRASLLTGLYPHQAGVGHMMNDRGFPGYRGDLNRSCVTIAEVLKPAGYATYMTGKWHVTPKIGADENKSNWPRQRGFDRFYGTIHGAGSFYDPNSLTRDNTQISPLADPEYQPETYYYTDAISDHAVRFIDEHATISDKSQPFFLYVAYTAAHWPMHALPQDIEKYDGEYDAGYRPIRKQRLKRMKQLGLVHPETQLPPDAEDWNDVEHREWEIACMQVYAAMVDNMDQGIGRIVAKLKEHDQLENTLIFFLQDNGGCAEGLGRRGQADPKTPPQEPLQAMAATELQTDMIPKKTRDGRPVRQGPGVMPGPAETYIAYGRGWANVSNTPFREYKHWVHEGGISTPLIVHWPAGVKRAGELEHQPGHLIDIMATCVDVARAHYPSLYRDQPITPLEGQSLTPAFHGETIERQALYWEHEGNRAIRVADWKLVAKENKPWELYDISVDRIEAQDLSQEMPEKVEELAAMWETWAERANVLPLGAWKGKPAEQSWSPQKRFELHANESLPREKSPAVHQRPYSITAEIDEWSPNGVIVAQGGSSNGYALFIEDGVLKFAVRSGGRLSLVQSDSPIQSGAVIHGRIRPNGKVRLQVDGTLVADGKLQHVLKEMPIDGLQVGQDSQGQVGEYQDGFVYSGKIATVLIEIQTPAKAKK